MQNKKIAITGLGIISPFGFEKEIFWQKLKEGTLAFRRVDSFITQSFKAKRAALINDGKLKANLDKDSYKINRCASLAYFAAKLALDDSGLIIDDSNTDAVGICAATTLSHTRCLTKTIKQVLRGDITYLDPAIMPHALLNAPSSFIAIQLNMQGFNTTISTGFTASIDAIGYAINLIKLGRVKSVLIVGIEEVTYQIFSLFYKLGLLAGVSGEEICCPFDKRRNGFILGEAAIGLMIEDENYAKSRKAMIYAQILGSSSCFRALGVGGNAEEFGLATAMADALSNAKIDISDIDYISCAANSLKEHDKLEVLAIKRIFGRNAKRIPASSIKSMIGESMSASGLLQIACVIGMMKNSFIAPTINYKFRDEECDLNLILDKAVHARIRTALINNSCLSGNNASLIISG